MGLIRFFKRSARLTGARVIRICSFLPPGVDVFRDIRILLPDYSIDTIFDVGANIGQSADIYSALFPSSHVLCFEPVAATFNQLQEATKRSNQVRCFKLGFSSGKGKRAVFASGKSTGNRLLNELEVSADSTDLPIEYVDVLTIDEFCASEKIELISYLKIDTEGEELEVLKGSEKMLTEQKIDLLQVEAGMNPGNRKHVAFEVLKAHLEQHDYYIFGIYDQCWEFFTNEPCLRRTNTVFISQRMIQKYRRTVKIYSNG